MDPAVLSGLLSGSGVAGIFCYLFIIGRVFPKAVVDDLKAELAEVKRDRDAQRDRADIAVTAAQGTSNILAALQAGARLGITPAERPVIKPGDLT